MDYSALKNLIDADATLAQWVTDRRDQDIADALNAPAVESPKPYYVNARTLMAVADIQTAETVLAALKAQSPTLFEIMLRVGSTDGTTGGVDVSLDATRAFIDQLQAGGAISVEQAAAIKGLGRQMVGKAQAAGLGPVSHTDVAIALRGGQ